MGVDGLSDEEFECFLQKEQKKNKRKRIILGISASAAVLGIYAAGGYAICKHAERMHEGMIENAIPRMPIEEVIAIVDEVKSPLEAFARLNKDIKFSPQFDLNHLGMDYWASLQETYGMLQGECEDGAIAFKAMLSDNPEYQVELVYLQSKKENIPSHMIAAYSEGGLWGIVSFNNIEEGENVSRLFAPVYTTMQNAIESYAEDRFKSWRTVEISSSSLISGRNLANRVESSSGEHRF
ncbi:MAG: hypothetical protein PHO02_01635 [Candidatus Nanoarchaeia archaeon]|nr:hypothetical protein [Candidatus Nanoarchaeia archaeon]